MACGRKYGGKQLGDKYEVLEISRIRMSVVERMSVKTAYQETMKYQDHPLTGGCVVEQGVIRDY